MTARLRFLCEKPVLSIGAGDALAKITTTTICGTDGHILKGEQRVGHEVDWHGIIDFGATHSQARVGGA